MHKLIPERQKNTRTTLRRKQTKRNYRISETGDRMADRADAIPLLHQTGIRTDISTMFFQDFFPEPNNANSWVFRDSFQGLSGGNICTYNSFATSQANLIT